MDWTRICKSLPMIFLLTSLICACGNDEEKQEAEKWAAHENHFSECTAWDN